jgi:methionyl aminopeptidase
MKTYNAEELQSLRKAGEILSSALLQTYKAIRAGISTLQLDKIAEDYILSRGGQPCFKDHRGYGFATCISVNHEVVHGMPRAGSVLKEGDIVSIDVGVRFGGMCADAARTFGVGKILPEAERLITETKNSFFAAIDGLRAGSTVGDIGRKVEDYIKKNTSYSIITNYFGHGIGKSVHEEPLIPNFRARTPALIINGKKKLPAGTAICIEPMINAGAKDVKTLSDGWTVVTADGKLSAHYENTLIVHADRVEVVTDAHI